MSGRMLATSLIFVASVLNAGCCCCTRPLFCRCGGGCGSEVAGGVGYGNQPCTSCYPANGSAAPAAVIGTPVMNTAPVVSPLPSMQPIPSAGPALGPPPSKPGGNPIIPPSSPGNNPMSIPSFPTSYNRGKSS